MNRSLSGNQWKNRKIVEENQWNEKFFEKIYKIVIPWDCPFKKENTQIINIRYWKRGYYYLTEIKSILREVYQSVYTNKLDKS